MSGSESFAFPLPTQKPISWRINKSVPFCCRHIVSDVASQPVLALVRGNARRCARSPSGRLVRDAWFPKASKKASASDQVWKPYFTQAMFDPVTVTFRSIAELRISPSRAGDTAQSNKFAFCNIKYRKLSSVD